MTFEKIDFDLRETVRNTIDLMATAARSKGFGNGIKALRDV